MSTFCGTSVTTTGYYREVKLILVAKKVGREKGGGGGGLIKRTGNEVEVHCMI